MITDRVHAQDKIDYSTQRALKPPVFDQPILPERILKSLIYVQDLHAFAGRKGYRVSSGITCYSLYPSEDKHWGVTLYDISEPFNRKDNTQTRVIFVLEGSATATVDAESQDLQPGHAVRMYPESTFSLNPAPTGCRFLLLTMPSSPESQPAENNAGVLVDETTSRIESELRELDPKNFTEECVNGTNRVYDLISGKTVDGRYNVSIMQIVVPRTQKHYHDEETERRVVLAGNLHAELDNKCYQLTQGQMIRVSPPVVHKYVSADQDRPVQLFAINYPAYNAANVRLVE